MIKKYAVRVLNEASLQPRVEAKAKQTPRKGCAGENGRGKEKKKKTNTGLCCQSLIEGISSVTITETKENPSFGWSKWPPGNVESESCRDRESLHLSVYKRTICQMADKKGRNDRTVIE